MTYQQGINLYHHEKHTCHTIASETTNGHNVLASRRRLIVGQKTHTTIKTQCEAGDCVSICDRPQPPRPCHGGGGKEAREREHGKTGAQSAARSLHPCAMAAAASTSLKCDRRPRQDPRRRGHCVGVERKNHASASANTITRQQCHQENALHCGQIEQQAAQSVLLQHVRGGGPQVNGTSSAHTTWRGTSVVVWTGPGSPSKRQLQHRKAGRAFGAIGVK